MSLEKWNRSQRQEKVTSFFNGLESEKTRDGARIIVMWLNDQRKKQWEERVSDNEWNEGWVRSGEIFSALHNTFTKSNTLIRLLSGLTAATIIERKDCARVKGWPGKPPVFYRVTEYYDPILFLSRGDLLILLQQAYDKLEESGISPKREQDDYINDKAISGQNPCDFLKKKIQNLKGTLLTELQKPDEEIRKEATERMKNINLMDNPDDVLDNMD